MPKCTKCNYTQSRLNKGALCKRCFQQKINPVNPVNEASIDKSCDDRSILDLIKGSMLQEKECNAEIKHILQEQITFLKQEIVTKNTLIERLLVELYERNPGSNKDSLNSDNTLSTASGDNISDAVRLNSTLSETSNGNKSKLEGHNKLQNGYDDRNVPTSIKSPIFHPNRYRVLIDDDDSNFETEFENADIKTVYKYKHPTRKSYCPEKRPEVVINQNPERDNLQFKPKHIPGNSTYANMASQGRKILLLSDSILGRIQMRKFNADIKIGRAYRKYFPGATPTEMAHHVIPSLLNDKPDVVVIHVGTNSLYNDDVDTIANDIFNLINICRNHGVNDVLVSGVVFRNQYLKKVRDLNNFLEANTSTYDFKFISNENITGMDIGKDNLHLNYTGIRKIAINIENCINTLHTY